MEPIYDLFDKHIGSTKISACLALCGYTQVKHFLLFQPESLTHMELYIGTVCNLMPKEERCKYIDKIFIENPKHFLFSSRCRDEILYIFNWIKTQLSKNVTVCDNTDEFLKFLQYHGTCTAPQPPKSDIPQNSFLENDNKSNLTESDISIKKIKTEEQVCPSVGDDQCNSDDCHDVSNTVEDDTRDLDVDNGNEAYLANCPDNYQKSEWIYQSIAEKAKKSFSNCDLSPKTDFKINMANSLHEDGSIRGFFVCKLCKTKRNSGNMIIFRISDRGNILFKNIQRHLKMHFKVAVYREPRFTKAIILLKKQIVSRDAALSEDSSNNNI